MAIIEREEKFRLLAERAIEDAECGAQLEIKDQGLREALHNAIKRQLWAVYEPSVVTRTDEEMQPNKGKMPWES